MADITGISNLTSNSNGSDSLTGIQTATSNINTELVDKAVGVAAAVDSEVALFSSTGGKQLKRASGSGWAKLVSGVLSLVSSIVEADLSLSDNTTNDSSTTKHGFLKKLSNVATEFLDGTGAFDSVKDSDLSTSDITTNNATASKHGFLPKLSGSATDVLKGDGSFGSINTVTYKNGTTSKDASDASTTQNIAHGLGKVPLKVKITAITVNAGAAPYNAIAETVYNGTTQSSVSTYFTSGSSTTATTFTLNTANANATQTGVVAFDGTNIIITWTKTGSSTGTYQLLWEAEG